VVQVNGGAQQGAGGGLFEADTDAEGNLQFEKILPTLVDKVRRSVSFCQVFMLIDCVQISYIPIPRVEYKDASPRTHRGESHVIRFSTLSGQQLFPGIIEVEAHRFKTTSAGKHAGKKKSVRDTSRGTNIHVRANTCDDARRSVFVLH